MAAEREWEGSQTFEKADRTRRTRSSVASRGGSALNAPRVAIQQIRTCMQRPGSERAEAEGDDEAGDHRQSGAGGAAVELHRTPGQCGHASQQAADAEARPNFAGLSRTGHGGTELRRPREQFFFAALMGMLIIENSGCKSRRWPATFSRMHGKLQHARAAPAALSLFCSDLPARRRGPPSLLTVFGDKQRRGMCRSRPSHMSQQGRPRPSARLPIGARTTAPLAVSYL